MYGETTDVMHQFNWDELNTFFEGVQSNFVCNLYILYDDIKVLTFSLCDGERQRPESGGWGICRIQRIKNRHTFIQLIDV